MVLELNTAVGSGQQCSVIVTLGGCITPGQTSCFCAAVSVAPVQAAETSPMDWFHIGWREVGSLPASGVLQSGWMGACAAPSQPPGAGNQRGLLPLSPGGALATCKCARILPGWPEWAFSSYLLFYLTALLIKTIFDSCHVLSAGWLAAAFCPSVV